MVAPSFPCGQGEFNNSYSPAVSIAEKEPKYLALRRERMARAAASAVQKKAENETKGTASEGDESSSSTGTGTNEKSSNGRRSSMKKRRSKEAASRQKQDSPKNGKEFKYLQGNYMVTLSVNILCTSFNIRTQPQKET